MGTKGHEKACTKCGKIFKSSRKYHSLCPSCSKIPIMIRRKTNKCPTCGKPIKPKDKQCRECRWKPYREKHVCPECGGKKTIAAELCFTCASKKRSGENHPNWKGGRYFNSDGYVMIYNPQHPRATSNGYVREHIKVWYDAYGDIPKGHIIHHINGVKSDNRLENLGIVPVSKHKTYLLINLLHSQIQKLEDRIKELEI